MTKRLYRSRKEKMVAGVAGGIAEYLELDPVFVRIAFVCLIFFHGAGIIIYFVSALIIPKEEIFGTEKTEEEQKNNEEVKSMEKAKRKANREKIIGGILIVLGVIFLADNLFINIDFEDIFPLMLIGIGSWMVFNTFKKEKAKELTNNDDNYDFEVSMENVHIHLKDDNHRKLEVGFNNKPNYNFDFELGAADVDLDLTSLKVEKVSLSTGAASCNLKVKEFASDTMTIKVEAGAASVRIVVPRDAGVQIRRETALATTHFDDFTEISDDLFQTENFSSAKKKIFLEIEGGVASFYVSRN